MAKAINTRIALIPFEIILPDDDFKDSPGADGGILDTPILGILQRPIRVVSGVGATMVVTKRGADRKSNAPSLITNVLQLP